MKFETITASNFTYFNFKWINVSRETSRLYRPKYTIKTLISAGETPLILPA